jgi:TonB family protein
MSEGYEELTFTLGNPTRDVDGYHSRYIEFALFEESNFFGLTYENLSPFWVVSDEKWDTPVIKCGSGIPSWSREKFSSTGSKIIHDESRSFEKPSFEEFQNQQIDEGYNEDAENNYVENIEVSDNDNQINEFTEQDAEYIGGASALYSYIGRNINYPQSAIEEQIQGKVFISFIIETDGSISNVKIDKGIVTELNNEAIRIVKSMPRWKPAYNNGKAVISSYVIPVNFKLE